MIKVLWYIWQLPQHLLGLLIILITKAEKQIIKGLPTYWSSPKINWGVSLGNYIIVRQGEKKQTIQHEHGHSLQSLKFGPLYLLIVGFPSVVFNNLWDKLFHKKWILNDRMAWYYSRWPEKQADILGGVNR